MNWNPTKRYRQLVALASELLEEERRTVRDVYYALESHGYRYTYRQVGRSIKKGRLAGMIDPSRIIDTSRWAGNEVDEGYESPDDFINNMVMGIEDWYSRNFWQEHDEYVEVWLEKAGLASVFAPICRGWNVRLELTRGDWSTTKCYEATVRLLQKLDDGKDITILYFGDYNPSGYHAPVAVQNTMQEFGVYLGRMSVGCDDPNYFDISPEGRIHYEYGGSLEFERVAMTTEHVQTFDLPANPTPSSSSKDRKIREYFIEYVSDNDVDMELNALKEFERDYLEELIENSIESHVDLEAWNHLMTETEEEREEIRKRIRIRGHVSREGDWLA